MLPPTMHSSISQAEAERTFAELHGRLARVEEVLAQAGIVVHGSSRLVLYRKRLDDLQRIKADATLPSEDLDSLNSVLLEADQLARSVLTASKEPEVEGWQPVTRRALKGAASPTGDAGFTPARDAQFELLLAALARRGGLSVRLLEPDLQVELEGRQTVGIAAKRVTSVSQLGRRVSQAAKQIKNSGQPGLIAVDLAFFTKEILRAPDMSSAMELLRVENRRFARSRLELLYGRVRMKAPLGLTTFVSRMVQLGETPQLATLTSGYATNLLGPRDQRLQLLDELVVGLQEGCRRWLD